MAQQGNVQEYETCDKINLIINNKYIEKFQLKEQFQNYSDFIQTCRHILNQATINVQKEVINYLNTSNTLSDQDKRKEALMYYIKQSTNDNFQYKNVRAGSRPELQEIIIRGNIYEDYKLKIYQDIMELLNKHSDEKIINALLSLIDQNVSQNIPEQTNYLIYEIYSQLYDKACIEVKFTQLYAKMIIQLTQKLLQQSYKTIIRSFIYYYHEEVLKEQDISFYKKNYDVSFELHKIVQNIIFAKNLKIEIDTLKPVGQKYQINESDEEQIKQQKRNIIDVHLKQSCLLALFLYLEDRERNMMTVDIFSSFLLYLLKKQIETNKTKYPSNNQQDSYVYWINAPNKQISNTIEGFYLKALITVLHEQKKRQKKLLDDVNMKLITETLSKVNSNILTAYDKFALSETLETQENTAQQNEIILSQEDQKQQQQQQKELQNSLKRQFQEDIDKVRKQWLHEECNLLELFTMLADITVEQKEQVSQIIASKKYDHIQQSISQLIRLIDNDKSQNIFLKQFQKVIDFISPKYAYDLILNICVEEKGEYYFKLLCHYMFQDKIKFEMIFNHKNVSVEILKSLIEQQIRLFCRQAFEEYEELANESQLATIKTLINSGDLKQLGKEESLISIMKGDIYGYFSQKDATNEDCTELINALDDCVISSLPRWLFGNVEQQQFIEKITQNKGDDPAQVLKAFFDIYPVALQIFQATQYCKDKEVKNLSKRLEHAIEEHLKGSPSELKELVESRQHFIAAQVLDAINKATNDDKKDQFVPVLELFDNVINKEVRNEIIGKYIESSKSFGQNLHLKQWFSTQSQ